ncbi:spore germination protein [Paludifilum halophilum]|uniref:Spore germination protein n=1 Tax=Paludifilum halophilum TaxID=1642702 RepID=A0A235B1V9_9BACL|nr:spore germination protein [Paludifilum halophilum]OYD06274.1 spore germination protein [Paludifilum halophilum]
MRFFHRSKRGRQASEMERSGDIPLNDDLESNIKQLKKELGYSPDLVVRSFDLGKNSDFRVAVVYMEGIVDEKVLNQWVMKTLMIDSGEFDQKISKEEALELIKKSALSVGNVESHRSWNQMIDALLNGQAIVLGEGWSEAISGDTTGGETKPITEPQSQTVVRGPKDSFTETLQTNLGLIRRRLKTPNLWVENTNCGKISRTKVSMVYIKGLANEELLNTVRKRLEKIEIDGILESGYIEEFIQDKAWTPFPTVFSTERPDIVSGNLLEGRVAILVDNTPFALVVPTTFFQFFQSVEDYYQRFDIATFTRLIRYFSYLVSLVTPAIYIALTSFHPEMIPTPLLIKLIGQRKEIPFPALVEALAMEFSFEVIREAGVRAPRVLSGAVTIVGAIVLGETVVRAGLATPSMVIVVAITAIASFASASFPISISARLIRFLLMLLGAFFGLFGILLAMILLIAHMNTLYSFGTPYLAPFAPLIVNDQKDTLIRVPIWALYRRPKSIHPVQDTKVPEGKRHLTKRRKGRRPR